MAAATIAAHVMHEVGAVHTPTRPGWIASLETTFSSLSNRNFRLFWTGQLVSQIGTWMQNVGQAWLVLDITHSAIALGTVTALQTLPILFTVLFAGVVVDRLPKRRILYVTQTISMLQAAALVALTASGQVQVWQIYLLAILLGFVNAFDQPTRQAFVVELVGREHVVNAVGLNAAQFSIARLVGPALAGLAIAAFGIATCFLLNAISFLAVLISLTFLRSAEFRRAIAPSRQTAVVVELREGVRFLLGKRELTVAMIVLLGNGAFVYSTSTIIPLIAEDALHVGASEFGLLVAAVGLGSLFAALVVARRARASEKTFLTAAACFGLLYLSLAVVSWFAVAFVVLALVGAAIQVFGTSVNSLLQLNSPDQLRGRVMSVFTLLTNGIQPAGSVLNGVVTAAAGVRVTVAVEASICLAALVAALMYRARTQPDPGGDSALPGSP
ncbi:MAG: MFS transporter [Chloroflexi bacterium]|nr:MFS transporter [Chloroflexota bacterium]